MMVWLDLETTGLDPRKHTVLEVAAIVTTDDLTEVDRFQRAVYFPYAAAIAGLFAAGVEPDPKYGFKADLLTEEMSKVVSYGGISPYVLNMHNKNGLWRDCVRGDSLKTVDYLLGELIIKHTPLVPKIVDGAENGAMVAVRPELAGSTVSFDRKFLEIYLPHTCAAMNYRNVDVSAFTETARRFWPAVHAARPEKSEAEKAHRGLADIEASLELYRYYVGALAPKAAV